MGRESMPGDDGERGVPAPQCDHREGRDGHRTRRTEDDDAEHVTGPTGLTAERPRLPAAVKRRVPDRKAPVGAKAARSG